MYEAYLNNSNGLHSIDIDINEPEFWQTNTNNNTDNDLSQHTVKFTFAVRTDELAWLTIDGNGVVSPAFGGTGTTREELHDYAEQAVSIWRAITGDTETTCRFNTIEGSVTNGQDNKHIIDA